MAEADDLRGDPEGFAEAFDLGEVFAGDEDGGAILIRDAAAALDGVEEFFSIIVYQFRRYVADGAEFFGGFGHAGGEVEEGFILQDLPGGEIGFVGDLFAECCNFSQDRELLRVEAGGAADAQEHFAGIGGFGGFDAHLIARISHPLQVLQLIDAFFHLFVDEGQIADVVDGVGELGFA